MNQPSRYPNSFDLLYTFRRTVPQMPRTAITAPARTLPLTPADRAAVAALLALKRIA